MAKCLVCVVLALVALPWYQASPLNVEDTAAEMLMGGLKSMQRIKPLVLGEDNSDKPAHKDEVAPDSIKEPDNHRTEETPKATTGEQEKRRTASRDENPIETTGTTSTPLDIVAMYKKARTDPTDDIFAAAEKDLTEVPTASHVASDEAREEAASPSVGGDGVKDKSAEDVEGDDNSVLHDSILPDPSSSSKHILQDHSNDDTAKQDVTTSAAGDSVSGDTGSHHADVAETSEDNASSTARNEPDESNDPPIDFAADEFSAHDYGVRDIDDSFSLDNLYTSEFESP